MATPDLLRKLLAAPGPSGYESPPAEVWREAARSFADVSADSMGSSVARVAGTGDGPLLAVVGHIDEIGLAVTHVDDEGFLGFRTIGGWDAEVLRAQRAVVLTRRGPVPAVVGRRWRGRPKQGESPGRTEHEELHLDVGARDRDDALAFVDVGDPVVLVGDPVELPNGRLVSRALDNRLGCYVALEAARRIAEAGDAPGDVAAVAGVQEEVGDFGGARTTAYTLEPAVALAVDVAPATDIPGGDKRQQGELKLGGGAAIGRGAPLNRVVFEFLRDAAEADAIPHSIEVYAGTTHTDADAVHLSRAGVPTGLISIPTRYLHTPVEIVSLDDVEACVRLVVAFARRLDAATRFLA